MKFYVSIAIAMVLFGLSSTVASAHPGRHVLTCRTSKKENKAPQLKFGLNRSNGTGWFAPEFYLFVDGNTYPMPSPDENQSYGSAFHDSPMGLIQITAENLVEGQYYNVSVSAIPNTVKAYDNDGKPVTWSLEDEKAQGECYDSNGSAKFEGLMRAYVQNGKSALSLDTTLVDCELKYNSGMACFR